MGKELWKFPTNVQNLAQMLAAGLVMDKGGYSGDTYFRDITEEFGSRVPVFRDTVPAKYIDPKQQEERDAVPVILMLDLNAYNAGQGYSSGADEVWANLPLPIGAIKEICFRDKKAKELFEDYLINFDNIPKYNGRRLHLKVSKKAFSSSADIEKTSILVDAKTKGLDRKGAAAEPDYEKAQCIGCALLTLYTIANRNSTYLDAYNYIANSIIGTEESEVDFLIKTMIDSVLVDDMLLDEPRMQFFVDVLREILAKKTAYSGKMLTENIMGFIESYQSEDVDINMIVARLKNLSSFKLSVLFKEFQGPLSRSILLFFLRDEVDELLEFEEKNPRIPLNPNDIVLAILLFSARSGYASFSLANKNLAELNYFASYAMAVAAAQDGNIFNDEIRIFYPIAEYFATEERFVKNKTAARLLGGELKWNMSLFIKPLTKLKKGREKYEKIDKDGSRYWEGDIEDNFLRSEAYNYCDFMKLFSTEKTMPAEVDMQVRKKLKL